MQEWKGNLRVRLFHLLPRQRSHKPFCRTLFSLLALSFVPCPKLLVFASFCPQSPHLPSKSFLSKSTLQAVFRIPNAEHTVPYIHVIVEQLSFARRRNSTALSSWEGNEQRGLQVPESSSDGNNTCFCILRRLPFCSAYVEISFIL